MARPIFRSRARSLFRNLAVLGVVVLAVWLGGLIWFAGRIDNYSVDTATVTDSIVVLTGGRGRVATGLDLLAGDRAERLFISGVYRGVEVEELLRVSQQEPGALECCITLGYAADDTVGNARETAAWMREEGFASLRLVTANYHMPRSLLEFGRAMPDVDILPHPVASPNVRLAGWWHRPGTAWLIAREYSKYLFSLARSLVFPEL